MNAATSWAAIFGSGVFHGVNPAMGWLFATALGLQRGSRAALLMALPPLALGHAASVLVVTSSALALGVIANAAVLRLFMGAVLIAWAAWHFIYGHRHRAQIGMTAGFVGLTLWSAATATLHGAGLMLIPALMPLCGVGGAGAGTGGALAGAMGPAAAATLVHTVVASVTSAAIAFAAYEYFGLGILRRGWINFDWLWSGALVLTGAALIALG
ncbi:MAG TPA: hypothetical protein VGZ01_00260 [Trinickia sp.]|nr:hypothetical protein [Trinickia sp.]